MAQCIVIFHRYSETSPEIQSSVVGGVANKLHPLPHPLKCCFLIKILRFTKNNK